MKKNIFNAANADEIITRVKTLSPTAKGRWVKLDVNTMLFHCNTVNNAVLQGAPSAATPTVKQLLIKTIALSILPQFPKGIKSDKRYVQTGNYDLEFEKKNRFYSNGYSLFKQQKNARLRTSFFGKLNTQEWGRFAWMHLDHHLRQFGV